MQDAALLQSSLVAPLQESELHLAHRQDVFNEAISLGDKDAHVSIPPRLFVYVSDESLHLDDSEDPPDGFTPSSMDLPGTPSRHRVIEISHMIRCECSPIPFLCWTCLSTKYRHSFLLQRNVRHDTNAIRVSFEA